MLGSERKIFMLKWIEKQLQQIFAKEPEKIKIVVLFMFLFISLFIFGNKWKTIENFKVHNFPKFNAICVSFL